MKRILFIFLFAAFISCKDGNISFIFSVTADMRSCTGDDIELFRGACEAIRYHGPGEFMVSPGDIDPPWGVLYTIKKYIREDYPWYPVVGNHEAETASDMEWLRSYNVSSENLPGVVSFGPVNGEETTYSFNHKDAHFIVLNQYYDGLSDTGSDGDVGDDLYNWLENDLMTNTLPLVFVFGHEPAHPLPDKESGRLRHEDDSLNAHPANRDRFLSILSDYDVAAYICGHTHNFSAEKVSGVWQIDAGHARGNADTGAKSTFLLFYIMDDLSVKYEAFRLNLNRMRYEGTEAKFLFQ